MEGPKAFVSNYHGVHAEAQACKAKRLPGTLEDAHKSGSWAELYERQNP
jgi:hypothetical protein